MRPVTLGSTLALVLAVTPVVMLPFGPSAHAAPSDPDDAWSCDAGLVSDVPADVAVRGDVRAPNGLSLSFSAGVMPRAYVDAVGAVLVATDAWTQSEADLFADTLGSSLVVRAHLGWRPSASGPYVMLGYGVATLGGGASGAEIIAGIVGSQPPEGRGDAEYVVDATLHMLDVELGWVFRFGDHWTLRTAIGALFTLAASVDVRPDAPRDTRAEAAFVAAADAYLAGELTAYVHSPTVTLGLAYAF